MLNNNIKNIFNEETISYIEDYLDILEKINILPPYLNKNILFEKILFSFGSIVFFDENHPINDIHGHKFKGYIYTDENNKINIYVRKQLLERELIFYHELTHALQIKEDIWGLVYDDEISYFINESITQFIAELIYNYKYSLNFKTKTYNSEDVRFLSGFTVESDLRTYQAFDYFTKKYLEVKSMKREDAARIAFSLDYDEVKDFYFEKNINISSRLNICLLRDIHEIFVTDRIYYTNQEISKLLDEGLEINALDGYTISRERQKMLYLDSIDYLNNI